jgi:ABC-type uncharacterized transport system involved in gliding motility auxiliary subunit
MKHDLRRFAPFGLLLAAIAAIVSFGLYIVFRVFDLRMQISLAFIIVGLAISILLDPQKALERLTGRQARYGTNTFLMTVAVVGILVVINYLGFNHSKQWDLTEDKSNTLAAETIATLASLKSDVKVEAYYSSSLSSDSANKLLRNYQENSQGKLSYEFIDPVKDPIRAQQANVTRDGTIVVKMDDRQEQISYISEQELTGALVRLSNPGERTIYFLTGHGEYTIDTSSDKNYSLAVSLLKAKNYTVNSLDLITNPEIPADALAILVAGPQKPLTEQEIAQIKAYQEKGGSLIYLAEPSLVTEFGDQTDLMVNYLDATWGIKLDDTYIIDFNTNNYDIVYAGKYNKHSITDKMNSLAIALPTARSVRAGNAPNGVTLTELALTTQNAWGESDLAALKQQQASRDPDKDLLGPVSFAVLVKMPIQKRGS